MRLWFKCLLGSSNGVSCSEGAYIHSHCICRDNYKSYQVSSEQRSFKHILDRRLANVLFLEKNSEILRENPDDCLATGTTNTLWTENTYSLRENFIKTASITNGVMGDCFIEHAMLYDRRCDCSA